MSSEMTMTIMELVVNSGSSRSYAMEAIAHAKKFQFEEAAELIQKAEEEIITAHRSQTDLIHKEAAGDKTELSLLLVHSQDHLMTALVVKDMAKEFIDLYKILYKQNGGDVVLD